MDALMMRIAFMYERYRSGAARQLVFITQRRVVLARWSGLMFRFRVPN